MNFAAFSGRLTRDAETKFAKSGTAVTKFTVAVDCGFGDKKRTEFMNCTMFKREGLAPHLTKGKAVIVTGEYQEERWEKDGQKHSRPGWIVSNVDFQQGSSGQAVAEQQPADHPRYDNQDLDDAPF